MTFKKFAYDHHRTCAANAETGHNLHHWRYDLNFYVINWLKKQGHVAPEKILERENWSTKKREKYSNDVVDEMEESGELRTLYDEFKQNLQAARTARVSETKSLNFLYLLTLYPDSARPVYLWQEIRDESIMGC